MVKITVEDKGRRYEYTGKAATIFISSIEAESDDKHAVMMVGLENPLKLTENTAVALGTIIKQVIENPFEQVIVANEIAKAMVDSMENGRTRVTEGHASIIPVQKETVPEARE